MPKYNFTGTDGKKFVVDAPAGVTESQAREIFSQQLGTGSLTNLSVGSSLTALTQAAAGLSSALASVTRGDIKGITSTLSKLTGVPVTNGIKVSDFLKTSAPTQTIGPLNTSQIQGLVAQTAASVNQSAATVSPSTGIGKFGVTPSQLEQQGFLKPGTVSNYLSNPSQLLSVLSSPTVWTGKSGVKNLAAFTGDVGKQTQVQQQLLQTSFQSLSQAGSITSQLPTKEVGALLQVASKLGSGVATAWSKGAAPADLVNTANQIAKQGQFALGFVDDKLPTSTKGEAIATGFKNTVNRAPVDQAVKSILANNKIPMPNYTTQSATEAATIASQSSSFNIGLASVISSSGISVATPSFNPASSSSTSDAVSLSKQRTQAADQLDQARANYESVLLANNNNRSNPAVQVAFAEFQAALKALDALG